jgi:GTP pyrophosphokinase
MPDAGLVERVNFVRDVADGEKPGCCRPAKACCRAEGMLRILDGLRVDDAARAAACLFAAAAFVPDAEAQIEPSFGEEVVRLVKGVRQLLRIGAIAVTQADVSKSSKSQVAARHEQVEALRKMLLAFAQDIRVVLVRLASRLQTLRWLAQTKTPPLPGVARAKRSTSMRRWPTGWASGR